MNDNFWWASKIKAKQFFFHWNTMIADDHGTISFLGLLQVVPMFRLPVGGEET